MWYFWIEFLDISRCGDNLHSLWVSVCFFIYFLFIYPESTGYISVTITCVENTTWHDLYQDYFFVYLNKSHIGELLITMTCYLYIISTHFEERPKLKMWFWIYPPINLSRYTPKDCWYEYYYSKKWYKNGCVCPPQKLGLMRATKVIVILVRKKPMAPKSSGNQSPQFKV